MNLSMNYKEINFSKFGESHFPGFIGIEVEEVTTGLAKARMEIKEIHFAPNGYLHAGSIVTLADTIAGYGCLYNLPETAASFTTIELKSNFTSGVKNGFIRAEAHLQHSGKTTQIWDVTVQSETSNKTIALFRCTQLILY